MYPKVFKCSPGSEALSAMLALLFVPSDPEKFICLDSYIYFESVWGATPIYLSVKSMLLFPGRLSVCWG